MSRFLFVGVLLLATASASLSDYLVIKLDVNKDYITDTAGKLPGVEEQPPAEAPAPALPPHWVHAYIEIRKDLKVNKPYDVQFAHKWGNKAIVPYDVMEPIKKQSLSEQYDQRKKAIARDGKTGVRYLELAEWSLTHAADRYFHEAMEDATLTEPLNKTVAAYHKLKPLIAKRPAMDDPTVTGLIEDLKREGYRSMESPAGHYTFLTNLPTNKAALDEVKRRLDVLDSTFEGFYYWFLFNGKGMMPQIPGHRLTVVLISNAKEFQSKHLVWGSPAIVADGFTPRTENVAIISSTNLDAGYGALSRSVRAGLQIVRAPERDLVNGDVWELNKGFIDVSSEEAMKRSVGRLAFMQTMLLVQKSLDEDAELAGTTHHALRQLIFAAGMLPQNVMVPEWIVHGLSANFDCPRGAVYRAVGIPSWSNLPLFKHYRRNKQLGDSKEVLKKTITDAYFRQARRTEAGLTGAADPGLIEHARQERLMARASSWALTYYVLKAGKLPGLIRYRDELNRLPRDLELSEATLEGCFNRAFEVSDPFADAWFAFMDNVHLTVPESEPHTVRMLTGAK